MESQLFHPYWKNEVEAFQQLWECCLTGITLNESLEKHSKSFAPLLNHKSTTALDIECTEKKKYDYRFHQKHTDFSLKRQYRVLNFLHPRINTQIQKYDKKQRDNRTFYNSDFIDHICVYKLSTIEHTDKIRIFDLKFLLTHNLPKSQNIL